MLLCYVWWAGSKQQQTCSLKYYSVDSNGDATGTAVVSRQYSHFQRGWYIAARSAFLSALAQNVSLSSLGSVAGSWGRPYIFASSGQPGVTYAVPFAMCSACSYPVSPSSLLCAACSNGPTLNLTGVIAVDMDFSALSRVLQRRFPNPAQLVFIVDKLTGNFMGASRNTPTSQLLPGSSSLSFLPAVQSAVPLIASVSQYLVANGWPTNLRVFGDNYVQVVETSLPGLALLIVVVMPAPVVDDSVAYGSGMSNAMLIMNSLGLFICIASLGAVIVFRDLKVIKSSQSEFTGLFLVGGLGLNIAGILLHGPNSDTRCAWCEICV
jgi:hypothetical protein